MASPCWILPSAFVFNVAGFLEQNLCRDDFLITLNKARSVHGGFLHFLSTRMSPSLRYGGQWAMMLDTLMLVSQCVRQSLPFGAGWSVLERLEVGASQTVWPQTSMLCTSCLLYWHF